MLPVPTCCAANACARFRRRRSRPQVKWSRCARTDKGVSAISQVVSAKLAADPLDTFAERVNAHANTHISVTYPAPKGDAPPRTELVRGWKDRADLVNVIETTIYIPFYAGSQLTTT